MASLYISTPTATLCACSSTNTIPKLKSKSKSNIIRCSNLVTTLRKLQHPYDLATRTCFIRHNNNTRFLVCFSNVVVAAVVSRAYIDDDSGNTPQADDDDYVGDEEDESYDLPSDSECQTDDVEIEIEKPGKNSRVIRSKVAIRASLQTVWDLLTDYERLADFIPSLAVSKLVEKGDNFARLFQIGEQNLAFGLKFNAKGTIDCFEKDLQTLPFGQKRDIEFKMVEGDFQLFEGKWSVEQSKFVVGQESQTTLVYTVHVKPKVWLPVRLVEGRLCNEIKTNLSCIREEAEKVFLKAHSVL